VKIVPERERLSVCASDMAGTLPSANSSTRLFIRLLIQCLLSRHCGH